MLEYIFLLRGNHPFQVPGLENPSLAVRLAILNGFFLFLYVTRRIFSANPMSAGMTVVVIVVVLGANLFVGLQPDLGSVFGIFTGRF